LVPEPDVIALLAEHWQEALSYFGPDDLTFLAVCIAAIEAAAEDEEAAHTALAHLTTVLALQLPPEHPVSQAISRQMRYANAPPADLIGIASVLRALPGLESLPHVQPAVQSTDGAGTADSADARAWLLAAPALTEQEVRDAGGDPSRTDLIRLPRADRRVMLPAFQFDSDGRMMPVVAQVNELLDAAGDPWGAADWWLGENIWLRGTPARLLGRVPDADLVLAAQAELPEE
jgi:hypothetical protein